MSGSKELMKGLDEAAKKLLERHFPANAATSNVLDPELQIKAFTACVAWYGPRTKLGGKDEEDKNEFTRLRDQLHGRRKARRDPGDTPAENGAASANGHDAAAE